ncbi:hypothetical protein ACP4OV_025644 [Aristida adscensionis]
MADASTTISRSLPATSSSRCVTRGITVTHDFEVTNFSLLDGIGIAASACTSARPPSPPPAATGASGSTPTAMRRDNDEATHTSAYLYLLQDDTEGDDTRVKFNLSLLDDRGRHVSRTRGKIRRTKREKDFETDLSRISTNTFHGEGDSWGFQKFFEKSVLRDLLRDSGDRFTIRCDLCVIEARTEDADAAVEVPTASLHRDLGRVLEAGHGADVAFSVGGRLFHAHRCVLAARCRVLEAELLGATKENAAPCVVVGDMEAVAFESLLHFVYTDSLPDRSFGMADRVVQMQHLLVAADRYGLDRLKAMCEASLCRWIDVQSVGTTLALAEQHRCVKLKDACLRFLGWPEVFRLVVKTDGYKHLVATFPSVTSEILEKTMSAKI